MNKNKFYRTIDSNSGLVVWEVLLEGARQARRNRDIKRAVELYHRSIKSSEEYFYNSCHEQTLEISIELDRYLLELRLCIPSGFGLNTGTWHKSIATVEPKLLPSQ
ncbi:MAG TPA: hypothetical protein PLC15_10220 [Candidatus Obscuribacter sp.]|nr:hypothetical protein [Candidatus Obscuribacter sp.]HMX47151.1 hypothetical protein [Candidatus Obscuribacter sp.]HMY04278.1 hypothetical protein [Candidatus Obscuribacter sp.]HNB15749.1 hypothetical protein [Candidatus Obscuribacter sp.]HND04145.1 hypothetical protein [Candidatus Obscuribacter sp.]